ncbi:BRCA1-A complex subunit RAP80-like isoform X3 [Myxocyprinus asiaticus]|uniref:BRCA1-A complex subunit RAP80-like isoform X3 n=1 Tax=Myxocyprinus asiaticus TaxID=70543 RepID=UPI002223A20A|nr:BRCA1-A complex subunit RAP80-like isoform X3 [Myxocyprinus asiaticus]
MPRRKRTADQDGRRAKFSKVENYEETLVISDSEREEVNEEQCAVKTSTRAARWRRRENDSQLQEMTEDEMLDLAMRLSAQEANSAAQKQHLEDDDIQKAIVESLNDRSVKSSVRWYEATSSSAQQQQSETKVKSHLRRKLSYPSQGGALHGKESPAAQDGDNKRETTSPLPEMPDLSQTTTPHHSSNSALLSGPHAASQHVHESSQDKTSDSQPLIRDSVEDDLSQSVSQSLCSPVFPQQGSFIRLPLVCVEKLSQDHIKASTDSINHLNTQGSAVGSTCPDRSQSTHQGSPIPKSPVFTQNDFRRKTDLLEVKDGHITSEENEGNTQIPDEDSPASLNHKGLSARSTDSDKCLSPSRGSQPSNPRCVSINYNADVTVRSKTHDLKQVKDQITLDENVKADSERASNTQSWHGFASHMVLHLTDDDDEDDGSEEVHSPSPVFHQETVSLPAQNKLSPTQPCISQAAVTLSPSTKDSQMSQPALEEDSKTSRGPASKPSDCKSPHTAVVKGDCTVSYYWGVPFCPQGQNPDDYTRVIMCQLEVYEKTLKEAQRELLRKAEWSPPVLPGSSERPFGTRRWKHHRDLQMSEDEEEKEEEGEKENNRIEVEGEEEENREESVVGSEEAAKCGQGETYVVLPSPETEDEEVHKSSFFSQVEPTPGSKHFRKDTSDDAQKQHPDEQEEEDAKNHEGYEEEATVCPETQMTESSTPELMVTSPDSPTQPQSRADSELMVGDGGAPAAEEVVMEQDSVPAEATPPDSQRMECPMCSKLFPLSRIEVHAAYCDGEAEDQDQQEEQSQVVSLRKRTRKDVTQETRHRSGNRSAKMEKCFLCQGFFPPQEYPEHVDLCLKKRDSKTNQGNGLLSALDQTERRHIGSDDAGPSDISIKSNCGLSDPAVMGASGGSVECSAMTSAPSNAFTPLAEDTDCLIDSSKNSQRLARKRKFKR